MPPLSRRSFLTCTSAALGLAALGAPPRPAMAQAAPEVTALEIISVRDPQHSAQLALALAEGFFEEEGIAVTPNYTINGPDLPSLAASGQVQILCCAMEQVANLRIQGLDFKWVMKLSDISNTQGVVIGDNSGITAPADLSGKRVGMYRGASVELAIENMCKQYGVDFSSLQFVNMEPPEQAMALQGGQIDVMACWEPYVSNAARNGGRLYFTGSRSYIEDPAKAVDVNWLYLATGLTVSGDFIAQAPNTVRGLMRAMMRATEIIVADPEAAAGPIAKGLGIPQEGLVAILQANDYRPDLDARLAEGYPVYIDWAVERGFLPKFVPLADILDTAFLAELAPGAVNL